MEFMLKPDDTKASLLIPGARVRVLGATSPFTHAQLRTRCEAVGLVWTSGRRPEVVVIGFPTKRGWLPYCGRICYPDQADLRQRPVITDTALLERIAILRSAQRVERDAAQNRLLDQAFTATRSFPRI
jgi:hypothetical protein